MSMKYLGETLDIHCGGKDLVFPHHENEIAQSEGATGKPFVHYWMHNGFINVDNQKMSKSLGNFFTVRDIAKEFDLEAVRMFMLGAQYRSPINFSTRDDRAGQGRRSTACIPRATTDLFLLRKREGRRAGREGAGAAWKRSRRRAKALTRQWTTT